VKGITKGQKEGKKVHGQTEIEWKQTPTAWS
jgi:hypothetical protein